jgi:hypothetical protein
VNCTCGHDEALHSMVFGCEASVTIKEGGGVDFGCRCVQFTPVEPEQERYELDRSDA